jgi:hypothetical protein
MDQVLMGRSGYWVWGRSLAAFVQSGSYGRGKEEEEKQEREGISKQLASTPLLLPPPAVIWIVVGKV